MRFTPHRGIYAYVRTNRKLKAAARRLRLDREKFPLFAEEIGESQPSPEHLLDARARSFVTSQQDNRDRAARNWWQARAELRPIPESARGAFIRHWNRRTEERREGIEWVRKWRTRWSTDHQKKKTNKSKR